MRKKSTVSIEESDAVSNQVSGTNIEREYIQKLKKIIKEQLEKLEVLSDEKNLDIRMMIDGDFVVSGDKKYLERAIWNLLINAIEYNHLDAFIKITIDKNQKFLG